MPRVRRARAAVVSWEDGRLVAFNFLTQRSLEVTTAGLSFLDSLGEWTALDRAAGYFAEFDPASVVGEIEKFVEAGLVVVDQSQEAEADARYEAVWEWGFLAAAHCFSSKDVNYLTVEECIDFLNQRREVRLSPKLFQTNEGLPDAGLPEPRRAGRLYEIMYHRRSIRKWSQEPVSRQDLSDVLFAGFGITAFVDDPDLGTLPLTMTPSGGARNPFEAYVAVRQVEGLAPGFYHYSAVDRTLGRVSGEPPQLARLVGNQEWADDAAFMIVLVAHWDRTIWKYPHPGAYRVVLIEAGHVAQNLLLSAADCGLVGVPTCATGDAHIEAALKLDRVAQAAVHTVVLGRPRSAGSWTEVVVPG